MFSFFKFLRDMEISHSLNSSRSVFQMIKYSHVKWQYSECGTNREQAIKI